MRGGDDFAVANRFTGEAVGEPRPAFADDETLVFVHPDEVVLVDRTTGAVDERYAMRPYTVPDEPAVAASGEAIYVDGVWERGGLLRVDRLTAELSAARPATSPGRTPRG